jgi:hypothetical protein
MENEFDLHLPRTHMQQPNKQCSSSKPSFKDVVGNLGNFEMLRGGAEEVVQEVLDASCQKHGEQKGA